MQIIWKLKLFLLVAFSQTIKCQEISNNIILGNWIQSNTDNRKLSFFRDGTFKEYYNGEESISKYNTKNKSNRYKIKEHSDTIWLYLTEKNVMSNNGIVKNFVKHYAVRINNNNLTMISYKEIKELYSHVDEYSIWVKEGSSGTMSSKCGKHIKYIFPPNFKGTAWIAFNQTNGVPPVYDNLGNAVLHIPENGLLITSLHEDVFATANKNYSLLEETNNSNIYYVYQAFDKFDKFDSTCCKPNEYIAVMCGFNQDGREAINGFFGRAIQGNVMAIYIGKYKWFEKNCLHPWDSKME